MKKFIFTGMVIGWLIGSGAGAAPLQQSGTLTTMEGDPLHLSSFEGKPLVIIFWANWCVPCRKEVAHLNKLYQGMFPHLNFIGINEDEKLEEGLAFIERYRPHYQSIKDDKFSWAEAMNVNSLPQLIVLSASGEEVYRGIEPPSLNKLQRLVEEEK